MQTLRIKKQIDSEILYLPEFKNMIGRNVEIVILAEPEKVLQENCNRPPEFGGRMPAACENDVKKLLLAAEGIFGLWKDRETDADAYIRDMRKDRVYGDD